MDRYFGRMFSLLYRKSQVYLTATLKKYNLSTAELPFLMALIRHDGISQDELSSLTDMDKALTARVVKSLEEKGCVTRIVDSDDKRRNKVFLSDKTKESADDLYAELKNWNDILTKGIDPKTLDTVYQALLVMEKNIGDFQFKRKTKTQ